MWAERRRRQKQGERGSGSFCLVSFCGSACVFLLAVPVDLVSRRVLEETPAAVGPQLGGVAKEGEAKLADVEGLGVLHLLGIGREVPSLQTKASKLNLLDGLDLRSFFVSLHRRQVHAFVLALRILSFLVLPKNTTEEEEKKEKTDTRNRSVLLFSLEWHPVGRLGTARSAKVRIYTCPHTPAYRGM